MAETKITNVVVPEVYNDYAIERSIYPSNLYKSGLMVLDPKLNENLQGGAKQFISPFWQDIIDQTTLDEVPSETVAITAVNITAEDMAMRRQFRIKMWGANAMSGVLAGSDPMTAISSMVENFWFSAYQANMFSVCQGVIANNVDADGSDMVNDVTAEAAAVDTLINSDNVIDTMFLLGDQYSKVTAISMHSVPYSRLVKNNLIDFIPENVQDVGFGTYLGKTVIIDDVRTSATETVGGAPTTVYWNMLYKNGALGFGESFNGYEPTEVDRDATKGGGIEYLHTRRVFAIHPMGFDWLEDTISGEFPTNVENATDSNWDRKYALKNVGFVLLKTLG